MTAREVLDDAARRWVLVSLDGEKLVLETMEGPVPADVLEECRAHKPELLRLLRWEAEADGLLLDASRRLAALWPKGETTFEGDSAFEGFEAEIDRAYRNQNLDELREALSRREAYARECWRVAR